MSEETLLAQLFTRRDEERSRMAGAMLNVREEDATLERNEQGIMRWYLHPDLPDRSVRSTIVYRYEIPPHSATGKQLVQGNVVSFVISGSGATEVNGTRHEWSAGDVIGIPPLMNGSQVQHFNDSDEVAMLITAEPNYIDAFGVDMGSGFEQLQTAPKEDDA